MDRQRKDVPKRGGTRVECSCIWLTTRETSADLIEMAPTGFFFFQKPRAQRQYGGVSLFISSVHKFTSISLPTQTRYECTSGKLRYGQSYYVGTIRESSLKCGEATRMDHGDAVGPFPGIAHVSFHTVHVCSNKNRIYCDKKSTLHHTYLQYS